MKTSIVIAALLSVLPASSCTELTFAIPGHVNSTPWVASSGTFVVVAWGASAAGKGDVMMASSRDGGKTFGTPVRVNSRPGDARLSGEIAPRVNLLPRRGAEPIITVTWNAKDTGTQIKTARSTDGGRRFSEAIALQSAGAAGDRGWQAAAIDDRGTVHAIWLDHRGLAGGAGKGHGGHKGEHDGVAMAQKSGLYYASTDGKSDRELFKGVCYCCKTALAIGPDGHLYAAWRHVFANNMRDIAFTTSRDGATFATLVRVHEDKWSINGCPDDGPAMAVDRSGTVHLVWPTVLNGAEGALLYSTTADGRRFTTPTRVPTLGSPKPSHPQIATDAAGRIMIAWDEVLGGVRSAAARSVSTRDGHIEFGEIVKLAEGASMYPVLAATLDGWFAVWSTPGPTATVRARLFH